MEVELWMSESVQDLEASVLMRYLDSQRNHVLGILDGLDDAALQRPALPSGWTCLGMVQHLTFDVERFWFGAVVAGDSTVIESLDETSNPWAIEPVATGDHVFTQYRDVCEQSNAIISTTPLDSAPAWWPADLFGDFRLDSVREIVLHVLTETASHAGHLDAARELIDGKQWLVLNV